MRAMKPLQAAPSLVDQVHESLLAAIADGHLRAGDRIVQEQLARELGVSRQPVQHALTLLRKEGVLSDAPGRGLQVAPLDLAHVQHMYEVRAVIEGLAFRLASAHCDPAALREGQALLSAGRAAVASGSVHAMIAADMAFHDFVYRLAANPLIAPAMETHWTQTRRVMGEVLMRNDKPRDIWDQHEALLNTMAAGDGDGAERQARQHISEAAAIMVQGLSQASAA
jgi:DNA-binding GntR family transcriptional regulator